MSDENKKNNSSWGGARDGAGRKLGGENKETKKKKIAEEEMKQRIIRSKDPLLTAQMNLAKGCQFLFVIETKRIKNKDGSWKEEKQKPRIVEDKETIESYLAGELENDDDYYFITTQKPDTRAIDSMFDRVFGRARQNIGLDGEIITKTLTDEQAEQILRRRIERDSDNSQERPD